MIRQGRIVVVVILSFLCSLTMAQEREGLVGWIVKDFFDGIVSLNPKVDSNYVSRQFLPWAFTLDNTLISTGVNLRCDIESTWYGNEQEPTIMARLDTRLQRHLHKKIGISAGYGGLSLSAATEVGAKNPGKNSFMSLSLSNRSIGGSFSYVSLREYKDGTLAVAGSNLSPYNLTSDYPATMRSFSGDIHYILNGNRFVYKAVTGCSMVQVRSAGSLMFMTRFRQGDLTFDRNERSMLSYTDGLYRYTTQQVSLGAGYSYNLVPLSKAASDSWTGKGYRNLTFNLTAIPMAVLYNHICTVYRYDDDGEGRTRFDGRIAPTLMVRSGVSFSWDRFGLLASVVYNRFGFKGVTTTIRQDNNKRKNEIDSSAIFDDLTAKISLIVRL